MTIKVYGHSTYNSQRVTLALFELGIQDFELVKVNLPAKEHLTPSFLSIQPFHQVPVLESGNFRLYESRAIVRYIAQKFKSQGPSLLGGTVEEQALVNQWVEVEAHRFNDEAFAAWTREYMLAWKLNRPLNEELVGELYAKLTKVFDVYEDQLSKSKYLAGEFYSMADLNIAPSLLRVMTLKPELITARQHVKAWYDDLTSRPAFQKMLEADAAWPYEYGPFAPHPTK